MTIDTGGKISHFNEALEICMLTYPANQIEPYWLMVNITEVKTYKNVIKGQDKE